MVDFLTKWLVKDDTQFWSRNTLGLGSVFAKGHADGSSRLTFLLTITALLFSFPHFFTSFTFYLFLLFLCLFTVPSPLALCWAPKMPHFHVPFVNSCLKNADVLKISLLIISRRKFIKKSLHYTNLILKIAKK